MEEQPLATGTAVAGAPTSITLDASASSRDGAYTGMLITITAGTGRGQTRAIGAYAGATRLASVLSAWAVAPDATSQYRIARDPFAALAAAPYPFNLSWNLPLERTRRYLGVLGTSLADVYDAFCEPATTGAAQAGAADSITLASSASAQDGAYVAMRLALVGGTGAGQTRPIVAYAGVARTATVNPRWATAPDASTRYEVLDTRPAARETLGLSIEQEAIITTPRQTDAALAPYYGLPRIDLADLGRVETFCAHTGLTSSELVDLLTQGLSRAELDAGLAASLFINATGETPPAMRIVTDASDPNHPVQRIAGLTLDRLDRLNRFIRLAAKLGWGYEALDWALQSVGASEIDLPALGQLAALARLRAATELSVLELCAFWSDMKTTGRGDGPHPADLFDRTFNAPAVLGGHDPYTSAMPIPFDPARPLSWNPARSTGQDGVIRGRLRAALGIGDDDLSRIATFVAAQLGFVVPLTLDLTTLTWLFRLAAGARLQGLPVEQSLVLLRLEFFPDRALPQPDVLAPTVEGVLAQWEYATWLGASRLTVWSLAYVVAGERTPGFRAPYEPDDVGALVASLATLAVPARLGPGSFADGRITDAGSAALFAQLLATGFLTAEGILLDSGARYVAAARRFPLTPASLVAQDIDPQEASAAFTALEQAEPPLLVSCGTKPPSAVLSPWFTADTDLGFLFAGDPHAPNKRSHVAGVLLRTRQCIAVSELAPLFALSARSFETADIDRAAAARVLEGLMQAKPAIVERAAAAGEERTIAAYEGPARRITVAERWTAIPTPGAPYAVIQRVATGTARAGTLWEIELAAGAANVDGAYNGMRIALRAGAGAGQAETIVAYDGETKVARCAGAWAVLPNATSAYEITAVFAEGAALAADATHIELAADASPTNGAYDGMTVRLLQTGTLSPLFTAASNLTFLFASAGAGQSRLVTAYTGATREATVATAWSPIPDATSAYRVTRIVNAGAARGASDTTIVLAATAAPDDGAYDRMTVRIAAGAGEGQQRTIAAYAGATRTAEVTPAWTTVPDERSSYEVIATVARGTARGGGASEILLQPDASPDDGAYTAMTVEIVPDPDADLERGQVRQVLLACQQEIEHTAGVIGSAAAMQHGVAMQGLADFLRSSLERLQALIPIATQAADLSDYLAELLTPPAGGQVPADLTLLIERLARLHVLFEQLDTSVAQMRGVAELPRAFNVVDMRDPSFADVRALSTLSTLELAFGDTGGALVKYLRRPPDPAPPGPKVDALSALSGWPPAQIAQLTAQLWPGGPNVSDYDAGTVAGVARLRRCFELCARTGLDADSLLQLCELATLGVLGGDGEVLASIWQTYERVATLALGAVSARFAGGDLAGVEEALRAALNEARRDALLGYAIHLLRAEDAAIDSPGALYEYLLIDVEMAGCDVTSRIAQGIASVQLYMQRCRMMLEPGVTDLSQIPEAWWEWLSTYRVWEANRRVFLYPENYLRPAARRGATPAFERLARSLLETNVTDATVSAGLRSYVEDLATVSNLVLCGAYEARQAKPGTSVVQATGVAVAGGTMTIALAASASPLFNHYVGMTVAITAGAGAGQSARIVGYDGAVREATVAQAWKTAPAAGSRYVITGPRTVETLVLVGRTAADPDVYYHRRLETSTGWTPWQEIRVTIPTPLVSPVLAFGRLLLFWSELKTVEGSRISSGEAASPAGPRSSTLTSRSAAVRFSFLAPDGTWSAPQTAAENVVLDYEQDYELDRYVELVLGGWRAYFSDTLVVWRKVYPLHVPALKLSAPQTALSGEQLLVNHGFAAPWNPDQPWPVPDAPPNNVPADRHALERNTYELVLRNNALANARLEPYAGSLPLVPSLAIDAGLSRAPLYTALFRYLPSAAQPYGPVLERDSGRLGIAASNTGNVFLDDFYGDDYPTASMPDRPAPTVALLGRVAGRIASLSTVTNRPGSFLFDNGDEAFLVRSSDPGLLTISETLLAQSPTPPLPPGNVYLTSELLTTTQPPPAPGELRYRFARISTDAGRRLAERLAQGGIEDLLSVEAQRTPEPPFARLEPAAAAVAPATDQLDFDGPYGAYFWELFFHAPFLLADTLGAAKRFAEARTWLERVFNPTQQPDPADAEGSERFWRFLPFRDMTLPSLAQTLTNPAQIEAYNDDPLDPDAIARLRIAAYAKAVVIRYVDNLLDWGDFLFTQDTREAIDQATNLYVMAADLLGPRPATLAAGAPPPPASFDEVKRSYSDRTVATGTARGATPTSITLASDASPLNDAYTGLYVAITAGPGEGTHSYVLAYDGATRTATVATPWSTPPSGASTYRVFAQGIPQFLIRLENTALARGALDTGTQLREIPFNDVNAYFCVPENERLSGCWDRVEDRLYKIRHCMNIAGQARPLGLFAPPLDPLALIAARRAGAAGLPVAAHAQMPVPKYRFTALLERARGVTAAVSQLGSALLGALERKDSEALALLQSSQQRRLLELTTLIKQQQVEDATQTGLALAASLAAAEGRKAYYAEQVAKGLSPAEVANIATMTLASVFNVLATATRTGSAIAYAVPQVGSPFAMTYGGQQLGAALSAGAGVFEGLAILSNFGAQLSMTLAQYQRRESEWGMQATLAGHDADQITAQQAANAAQLKMAEQDLLAHRATIAQSEAMETFLKGKFTDEELYQWMAARLSTLHFQTYSIALELARSAQRAYQYELGSDASFVNFGYWDDGRRGLLCGEGLALALNQMEQSYLERNGRQLEIEKTISLLEVNPRAVLDLIATGECVFELPERLFDDDFPGHYARRIKTLAVSIPALTGPYQNIHATLTQLTNQLVVQPDAGTVSFLLGTPDAPLPGPDTLRSNWWVSQQIALSSGVSDDGVFEPSPADERYLPFEGTGAVSTWRLSMPKQTNRIDFATISDVVLALRYTALDGGARLREQVVRLPAMRSTAGSVFLPLAQRFSTEWYAFLHHAPRGTRQVLTFELEHLIPPHIEQATLTGLFFHLDVPAGTKTRAGKPYLRLELGGTVAVPFDLDTGASHTHIFPTPPAARAIDGPASLGFVLADTPADLKTKGSDSVLNPAVIENAVLILFYEGRVAW